MLPVAILAGGLATRLRPVTETIPKALIEIQGEPFLAHQLRLLRAAGVRHVVMCVGYLGEQVREFAGTGAAFGLDVQYAFDGPRLLGTAGAIRRALPLLGDEFFVLYGDSYLPCDYAAVERTFHAQGRAGLMTVYRNLGQWDTSNVEYKDGQILAYDKQARTPRMQHIDYGLGAFRAAAFETLGGEPADLARLYQDLLAQGELAAHESDERFYEIGSFAGIAELEALLHRPRAVFLDRDGVLNEAVVREGKPYPPRSPEEVVVAPGAAEALERLRDAGYRLIVVSNQPDVARGTATRAEVEAIHAVLAAALPIDQFRVCYHDDRDRCTCRKPLPGLLLDAATQLGIDVAQSWMVGDRWRDVDAGAAAGCRTILLNRGYAERGPSCPPDRLVGSLGEAADAILG